MCLHCDMLALAWEEIEGGLGAKDAIDATVAALGDLFAAIEPDRDREMAVSHLLGRFERVVAHRRKLMMDGISDEIGEPIGNA